MKEWVLKKYGWDSLDAYGEYIKCKKMILDAGTGLGREVANFCQHNKEAEVFGVELSNCVDEAYENTKEYPNAHIIQADIISLPFKPGIFDLIFSEGVLHHTPHTKKAFDSLVNHLTKGGEIAIYIYKVKGPIREFCDDYIRQYSTKLNLKECWKFSEAMTKLGKALSDLKVELEVPEDIPILQIKAGRYDLQRFFYWNILKCFWNDRFSFEENNLVNFDWYHPAYAHRHTPEEVKSWFNKSDLEIVWFNVEEAGITVRGKRV